MRFINKNETFLLEEIVKRNFSSKYKDSVLGIFWSILRPLIMMAFLTIIFSTLFSRTIDNFPVYFLSGRCIFDFLTGGINVSMGAIKGNKGILQRTPAPKHIFVLGSILSEFINFIISVFMLLCVMIATNSPFYLTIMPLSIIPIISLFIMVTGLGLLLSILCVYFSDIQHLWGLIAMMLVYASAVFFPMDIIPEPYRHIMLLNPIYWIIDQFRCFIYQGVIPNTSYIINSLLLSTIFLVLGVIVFKKYEKKVAMKF